MSEKDYMMFGISKEEIREEYLNSLTCRVGGVSMLVASILSNVQEMVERGYDKERIRKELNIAKFCLFEAEREGA